MLGIGNFDILLMVKWKIIKVAWKATNAYVKVKLRLFERILAKVRFFLESAIFLRLLFLFEGSNMVDLRVRFKYGVGGVIFGIILSVQGRNLAELTFFFFLRTKN